ncbi:hypothetical protein TRVL_08253 [Trypanosoma vivax]|nr:hypothetical protein TRVL_08253 [Trypanosoma vivax]
MEMHMKGMREVKEPQKTLYAIERWRKGSNQIKLSVTYERQKMLLRRKEAEGVKDPTRKCRAKCGFIIFDAGGECQPEVELPTSEWGCVVLSSPNKSNYEEWMDQKGALHIFISC